MIKYTYYFPHDYNARADKKIKNLVRAHGAKGYGIYWMLVEDLYNNDNYLPYDVRAIAKDFRENFKIVESILNDFELFFIKNENFSSNSVEKRLQKMLSKSESARQSALSRHTQPANAQRTLTERSAINKSKEDKSKEDKNLEANASVGSSPTADTISQEKLFEDLPQDLKSIAAFIRTHKPSFIQPYVALWNAWVVKYRSASLVGKVQAVTDKRKKKLSARLKDRSWDFPGILGKAALSENCVTSSWFSFDWIFQSESNYIKVLEGNYDNPAITEKPLTTTSTSTSELEKRILQRNGQA